MSSAVVLIVIEDNADLISIFFSVPTMQGIHMLVKAALMEKNRVCSVPTGSIRSCARLSANFTKGFLNSDQKQPQPQKQQEKIPMHFSMEEQVSFFETCFPVWSMFLFFFIPVTASSVFAF